MSPGWSDETNLGLFKISFLYILAPRKHTVKSHRFVPLGANMTPNLAPNMTKPGLFHLSPGFLPFGANLTQFGAKDTIPAWM